MLINCAVLMRVVRCGVASDDDDDDDDDGDDDDDDEVNVLWW